MPFPYKASSYRTRVEDGQGGRGLKDDLYRSEHDRLPIPVWSTNWKVCPLPEILTITLNPAVDLATSVERVVAGPKLYCKSPRVDPGGGGVNVARSICKLGGTAKALLTIGGASGQRLLRMLETDGVPVCPVPVSGETRESFAVTDESTGEQYRFSVPGQTLNADEGDTLIAEIASNTSRDGYVVLSGGVAPGLSDAYPARIFSTIAPRTENLVVDTSKAPLKRLIAQPTVPVRVLRLDLREAQQAAGHELKSAAECAAFAKTLVSRGVARIIISGLQAEGSILVSADASYVCRTPQVPVVSKIGAGDSFVGAFTLSLSQGDPPDLALRWGVAAASATMGTAGTGLCDRSVTEALLQYCHVKPI